MCTPVNALTQLVNTNRPPLSPMIRTSKKRRNKAEVLIWHHHENAVEFLWYNSLKVRKYVTPICKYARFIKYILEENQTNQFSTFNLHFSRRTHLQVE